MKKAIAIITNTMVVGGVEKVLAEILNTFDYDNYDVTLFLRSRGGDFSHFIPSNVTIKYWEDGSSKERLRQMYESRQYSMLFRGLFYRVMTRMSTKNYIRNELYSAKAMGLLEDKCYECVIAFQGLSPAVIGTALYRINAPIKIAWIHGEDSFPAREVPFMAREFRKFDRIFCVSKAVQNIFSQRFRGTGELAAVFYNMINRDEVINKASLQSESLGPCALVTVGRLEDVKGQNLIPKTVRLLLDAGYEPHWYLVGDGNLRDKIEDEMIKFDVSDHVTLLGSKTNPYPYIKACDIYVQTSLSEGWGITVQEARILCKPIVTTNLPVMREQLISGENGLMIDSMTSESLFEGIKMLLDHPELCGKFEERLKNEAVDYRTELRKLYDVINS
jgi:glycosyltransferase involved in cell wall biosynthesis